jgi:hypothetical protein
MRTSNVVASVATAADTAADKDWQINVCELTAMHYLTFGTVHVILTNNLGQVRKSAHWVPKLLSTAQKRRVKRRGNFLDLYRRRLLAVLNKRVMMDKTGCFLTHPRNINQKADDGVGEEEPSRPSKFPVHTNRSQQIMLKGVIYNNYIPSDITINADYVKKALARLLVILRTKRPVYHPRISCLSPGVPDSEGGEDNLTPSLFSISRPSRRFPLSESEVRAG